MKRDYSRFTHHASRTRVWLFVLVGLITAVTACNNTEPSPTPTTLAPTKAALNQPLPTATEVSTTIPVPTATWVSALSPEPYPIVIEPPATAQTLASTYPESETPISTDIKLAATITPTQETAVATSTFPDTIYLPFIAQDGITPPSESTKSSATPIPTLDFTAIQAELQAQGQDIAYTKIGFHTGIFGNNEGLYQWMQELDAASVPFYLKSTDDAEPIYFAQELMKKSGVPHTLVYRKVSGGTRSNLPNYDLPPAVAAQEHWQLHRDAFPPELDPNYVWLETVNEVDRNRSEWLAQFALETAALTMRDGYKWAAFGWASGEPEPEHWQLPSMLDFLRLAGENPDKLAIAVHEYSYETEEIGHGYPYKIGRFLDLFNITDQYGIPRPTILITEWGWTYDNVPVPEQALIDIDWASRLYAPYPEVKGAGIWYLGYSENNIPEETQRLIDPLREYSLTHYFTAPIPPEKASTDASQYPPPPPND